MPLYFNRLSTHNPITVHPLSFIGNRRGETRILGCEGGFAAFTPQNAELTTATPREPPLSFRTTCNPGL